MYADMVDDPGLKEFILSKKDKIKPLGLKEGIVFMDALDVCEKMNI